MADLTTLASVREHLQISDAADTDQDALINTLIDAASAKIADYAQREFASDAVGEVSRDFRYNGRGVLSLAPYDLRTLTSVKIDVDGANPVPLTLTADDYRTLPLSKRDGVWHSLQLRGLDVASRSSDTTYENFRVVRVTGTWGYPTIPAAVKSACNITVAYWLRETSQWMGTAMGSDDTDITRRAALPPIVKQMLDPYRKRAI